MSERPKDAMASGFRLLGRIMTLGADDYTATATALPENGDPSEVLSITQTLETREAADRALDELMARIEAIVVKAGGVVTDRRKDAL